MTLTIINKNFQETEICKKPSSIKFLSATLLQGSHQSGNLCVICQSGAFSCRKICLDEHTYFRKENNEGALQNDSHEQHEPRRKATSVCALAIMRWSRQSCIFAESV